ncbi:helix-turn-helix domain-containing protein [Metabacillus litoralis]|uniref:helix-turn-helix domain-containing protein n=1 Tax=Metabacillus litoralis TaxID=152268 RepID=UPI003975AF57
MLNEQKRGLESARARGRNGGRPKVNEKQINKALNLYHSKEYSISEIVEMTGISQVTLYRYIRTTGKAKKNKLILI